MRAFKHNNIDYQPKNDLVTMLLAVFSNTPTPKTITAAISPFFNHSFAFPCFSASPPAIANWIPAHTIAITTMMIPIVIMKFATVSIKSSISVRVNPLSPTPGCTSAEATIGITKRDSNTSPGKYIFSLLIFTSLSSVHGLNQLGWFRFQNNLYLKFIKSFPLLNS